MFPFRRSKGDHRKHLESSRELEDGSGGFWIDQEAARRIGSRVMKQGPSAIKRPEGSEAHFFSPKVFREVPMPEEALCMLLVYEYCVNRRS